MSASSTWTLAQWQQAYRSREFSPQDLLVPLLASLDQGDPAWISRLDHEQLLARLDRLERQLNEAGGLDHLPLYGVPFAVKDNIDAAGLPTTCACPDFSYMPERSATVVERLEAAGAVLLGKTNLDQFATGLVGTRSPYGAVPNAFNPDYISGGSSSGSAVVVARGLVPFSLGTDTAGSGRVPAGLNNIVGLKPTRGLISNRGLVPACRTLDCISVFALTVDDAEYILDIAGGFDSEDSYSRPRPAAPVSTSPARPVIGVPSQLRWFGDEHSAAAFDTALAVVNNLDAEIKTLDFAPLHEVAELLYSGPWVAERYAAIESVMRDRPEIVNPVVRGVIANAEQFTAVDTFKAEYRRAQLARVADELMAGVDALLVPTAPAAYTHAQLAAEPVLFNSNLGTYTNFVNLLDWCALAVPTGRRADGLPFGVTLIGPTWADARLAVLGRRLAEATPQPLGTSQRFAEPLSLQPLPVAPLAATA